MPKIAASIHGQLIMGAYAFDPMCLLSLYTVLRRWLTPAGVALAYAEAVRMVWPQVAEFFL